MGTFVSTINWAISKKLNRLVLISYVHFTIWNKMIHIIQKDVSTNWLMAESPMAKSKCRISCAVCRRPNSESVEADCFDCPKPSSCLTHSDWYLVALTWCRSERNQATRRHLVIAFATFSAIGISQGRAFLKWRSPEWSDNECQYTSRHCDEPDFLTMRQHFDCRCRQLKSIWSQLVETCMLADWAIKPPLSCQA